eukprot:tig00001130_g7259.t1
MNPPKIVASAERQAAGQHAQRPSPKDPSPPPPASGNYRYVILKGNNSAIVKDALSKRPWWEESSDERVWNFFWKQTGHKIDYASLSSKSRQIVNHFEGNGEICTKSGLYRNLRAYFERNCANVFDAIPITYLVRGGTKDREFLEFVAFFKALALKKFDERHGLSKRTASIKKEKKEREARPRKKGEEGEAPEPDETPRERALAATVAGRPAAEPAPVGKGRLPTAPAQRSSGPPAHAPAKAKPRASGVSPPAPKGNESFGKLPQLPAVRHLTGAAGRGAESEFEDNAGRGEGGAGEEARRALSDSERASEAQKARRAAKYAAAIERAGRAAPSPARPGGEEEEKAAPAPRPRQAPAVTGASMSLEGAAKGAARPAGRQGWAAGVGRERYARRQVAPEDCAHNIWIVKPTGLNRGRGIQVFSNLAALTEIISSESATHGWIIQKYMERPMLIHNRKFDIRCYVLVDSALNIYLYRDGYLRTSSAQFDCENLRDLFVHLTNNAVQKTGSNYGEHEEGNQLSYEQFDRYLEEFGPRVAGDRPLCMELDFAPRMKELVVQSMLSVRKMMNAMNRRWCFEVFGYDFMIDSRNRVWLIEVNTNPCLEIASALLGRILPRMVDDALRIALDPLFPPPPGAHPPPASENGFELLYSDVPAAAASAAHPPVPPVPAAQASSLAPPDHPKHPSPLPAASPLPDAPSAAA